MAKFELAAGAIGAYEKTLTANTVDEVLFADILDAVEVISDGSASIFVTIDGSAPTVGGAKTYYLPASPSSRLLVPRDVSSTLPRSVLVVKLISAGTPAYSVARLT